MKFSIKKFNGNEKLLSIHVNRYIYTGGTSQTLINRSKNKILYKHSKSITHVSSLNIKNKCGVENEVNTKHSKILGCSSYDCTVSIFKDDSLMDVIEGPDTEIKCVEFSECGKFLAMCTRGKTVWVCSIKDLDKNLYIEIDKVLDDHLEDVKGCKFHNGMLFTYGYDNSIKIYEFFDLDESWELVQSVEEEYTIWDIVFIEDKMFGCNSNGEIKEYILERGWTPSKKIKISHLPIYSIASCKNLIVSPVNLGNIVFLDTNFKEIQRIENLHEDYINCVYFSEQDNVLATCSDDQYYCIIELDFNE